MTYAELLAILNSMNDDEDQKSLLDAEVSAIVGDDKFPLDLVQSGSTQAIVLIPKFED